MATRRQAGPVARGGRPCQPFSLGGKHLAEQDGRNLFPEVFRAVRALQPKAVLLENVRGLARPSFRPYFEYILRQLRFPSIKPKHDELWEEHNARIIAHESSARHEPEYQVSWVPFDAADFGIPQNRLRVFIAGTQADLPAYEFPKRFQNKVATAPNVRVARFTDTKPGGLDRSSYAVIVGKFFFGLTILREHTQRGTTKNSLAVGISKMGIPVRPSRTHTANRNLIEQPTSLPARRLRYGWALVDVKILPAALLGRVCSHTLTG
jgi:site-specific DNA-cytosine methylase